MASAIRLLIFGLGPQDCAADVQRLLGPCGETRLEICTMPGDTTQRFVMVHLGIAAASAAQVATRINGCRLHGHRLQSWVPAMPWA